MDNYVHLYKLFGTFYRDSVLMKAFMHDHFHNLHTYNFHISDYVSTLLSQTVVVKCDYVQKQVQKLSLL